MNNIENRDYKILLLDDDYIFINSVSAFFKVSGYNYSYANTTEEALKKVMFEHIDIIILNCSLLPNDYNSIIKKFREINKSIYIILLTDNNETFPPIDIIRNLNIQSHYQKGDNFSKLIITIDTAINSIKQVNEIKLVNQQLKNTHDMLEKSYFDSIQTLRYTVEAKDTYTRGHSDRVAEYSVLIGKHLNLSNDDLRNLQIGGIFHDIGKIGVPDNILQKVRKTYR